MNHANRTARLIAAIASLAVTTTLFSSIVSLAGPERGVLLAKSQAQPPVAAASRPIRVAVAR